MPPLAAAGVQYIQAFIWEATVYRSDKANMSPYIGRARNRVVRRCVLTILGSATIFSFTRGCNIIKFKITKTNSEKVIDPSIAYHHYLRTLK